MENAQRALHPVHAVGPFPRMQLALLVRHQGEFAERGCDPVDQQREHVSFLPVGCQPTNLSPSSSRGAIRWMRPKPATNRPSMMLKRKQWKSPKLIYISAEGCCAR